MTATAAAGSALSPPFAYFGGKTTLGPKIAGLLPAHEHYVEPFCGGSSVLLAKSPSVMETVNDLDGRLMMFWRVLRDRPEDLLRVCSLTPHARGEYEACMDVEADPIGDELETARRVWVRLSQGRSGTQLRSGWRHFVAPHAPGMPGYLQAYRDRMAGVAERLARVSLECKPALELISKYGGSPDTCFYVDPPYLHSTRNPRDRYLVEMKSVEQHRELAAALRDVRGPVVLSGYDSPLYDELYAGWHRTRFIATTNGDATQARAVRTEILWSNQPLGEPTLFGDIDPSLEGETVVTID